MASVATCAVDEKLDSPNPQHPEFRSLMRGLRREVGTREAHETALAVKNLLLAEPVIQEAATLAVYAATDGEVDVSDVARWAQEAGKRLFFPMMREDEAAETNAGSRLVGDRGRGEHMRESRIAETNSTPTGKHQPTDPSARTPLRIAFVEWLPGTPWAKGAFGIPEPAGGKEIAIENCDAALVPGVAFGKDGSRVGRGKGYYDKALTFLAEGSRPRPPVLFGICHDFQIVEGLKHSPMAAKDRDIPMDAVVSPAGIRWRG